MTLLPLFSLFTYEYRLFHCVLLIVVAIVNFYLIQMYDMMWHARHKLYQYISLRIDYALNVHCFCLKMVNGKWLPIL